MSERAELCKVRITAGGSSVEGVLFDTPCARAVMDALPVSAVPREWGDEFYFEVPVEEALDATARRVMRVGDIGYWPPGRALAVFFGPTPASTGADPVAASEVNVVGCVTGDAAVLRRALGADSITVERIEEGG